MSTKSSETPVLISEALWGASLSLESHYSLKKIRVGNLVDAAKTLICNPSTSRMKGWANEKRADGAPVHHHVSSDMWREPNRATTWSLAWVALTQNIPLPVSCSVTYVSDPQHAQAAAEPGHSAHPRGHSMVYMLYCAALTTWTLILFGLTRDPPDCAMLSKDRLILLVFSLSSLSKVYVKSPPELSRSAVNLWMSNYEHILLKLGLDWHHWHYCLEFCVVLCHPSLCGFKISVGSSTRVDFNQQLQQLPELSSQNLWLSAWFFCHRQNLNVV